MTEPNEDYRDPAPIRSVSEEEYRELSKSFQRPTGPTTTTRWFISHPDQRDILDWKVVVGWVVMTILTIIGVVAIALLLLLLLAAAQALYDVIVH